MRPRTDGFRQLAGRLVLTAIDVFVTLSEQEGAGRCRLFLLSAVAEGRGERLGIGFGGFSGRVALRGLAGPGGLALEDCLTISSEERETWTAASLRGFGVKAKARKRQADGHVSDNHSWLGLGGSNVVRRTGRL